MPITVFKRPLRVMIDPGHGGKDPGAVKDGIQEKVIALEVAKLLREELNRFGIHNFLTRDVDQFVELSERVNMAKVYRADIFISLHCNSSDSDASGLETIVRTGDPRSYTLAKETQSSILREFPGVRDRGVKLSPSPSYNRSLFVLAKAPCPAILVELDFISSRSKELSDAKNQKGYACSIANAVVKFAKTI